MDIKKHRKNTTIIGVFFIIAAISAIVGLTLYSPILNETNYLTEGAKYSNQIILGAFLELILVSTAVGTGITLFPYLKIQSETIALGYFCFRMLETIFIVIGIISVLSLLTLSQNYSIVEQANTETYKAIGATLKAIHSWCFMLGPNFMLGINTMLYSCALYQSNLIPKKIASLGMISSVLIFIAALLEIFGIILQISTMGILLALPIFVYEMTLAIWLIVKGFNLPILEEK